MPSIIKDIASWLEFNILDSNDDPIVLVEDSQINVFYKKFGELSFTQKTPLVPVVDKDDIQDGENFTEIGFGIYAILFSSVELDTPETFTWVVIPDNPGALDFKQWSQQVDIESDADVTEGVATLNTNVATLQNSVTNGFSAVDSDLTTIQTALTTLTGTINSIKTSVDIIENTQPSTINVSFY